MTFFELAKTLHVLEQTASRNEMMRVLSELFASITPEEIGIICYLIQGRVAPQFRAIEFGISEKFMIRAISRATGATEEDVRNEFRTDGDLGITCERLTGNKTIAKHMSVKQVFERLTDIALLGGEGSQEQKIQHMADLLGDLDGLSRRFVTRIPLDKLRLGFSDVTILDALSFMTHGDKSLRVTLENAYNIHPDIGVVAKEFKKHGAGGLTHLKATVGVPIMPALCQRLPTAKEMIKKMGTVAVEPKYDGVRVQIHYTRRKGNTGYEIQTFSRNLEQTTDMFPELVQAVSQIQATSIILDCEAIGIDPNTGKFIPFQETMTRKRKHDIANASKRVPLQFFAFDVLFLDGNDMLHLPLSERKKLLHAVIGPGELLRVSTHIVTNDELKLRSHHDEQLKKGLEGVVVKKWESPYEPGRRGFSWVKFKEEEGTVGKLDDTIDAVVMGYYRGEGKRAGFGIGAFLVGIRDGDQFVTITKIGTGVSDVQWGELRGRLENIAAPHIPKQYRDVDKTFIPDVWVHPALVVEIAGDDLTKSKSHGAGVAVRFPRLVRIRGDKSPNQATTVSEVQTLFKNQKSRQ